MSTFGSKHPAFWIDSKTQSKTPIISTTSIVGVSSIITFTNAHDFEAGMMVKLYLVSGNFYDGWAYIISVPTYNTILINVDVGTNAGFDLATCKAYIGLERSKITRTGFVETDKIVHTSVLTGTRHTTKKGTYSSFEVELNLVNMDATDRVNLSKLLYKYNGTNVLFYPHVDKEYIKDSSNVGVDFNIDVNFNYLTTTDFEDLGIVTFISQKYTDISQNIG